MGANIKQASGFTLVEISIVMIIIGLLIGGTFGGMKLIDNMQVNRTVQDLKAIESAALTFKDTYGRLPGDIRDPSTRLPNCTAAPCSTAGNGDRQLDAAVASRAALADTSERFTFWHHLAAADLLSVGIKGTTDLSFGEGQPDAPLGGGYRVDKINGQFGGGASYVFRGAVIFNAVEHSAALAWPTPMIISCPFVASVDRKMDDGICYNGFVQGWACAASSGGLGDPLAPYFTSSTGAIVYDLKGI